MSLYSIRDLEHLSGIKAHTLRIWEQRYNIIAPQRTDTNIRYYNDVDLKLVLNISLLKDNGHKISHIAEMSHEDMQSEVLKITATSTNASEQIQALTLAMIDLDEDRFEKIVTTNILQMGFEKTMLDVIYPFLVRIGFLWQTGAINPAQEHFISNLIRQKLIVAIDGQVLKLEKNSPTYLLYLPEGELHELTLLFASYLVKARNRKVIYLGQSLPFNDLIETGKIHNPNYILTILTAAPMAEGVDKYLCEISKAFPNAKILVGGYQVIGQDYELPKSVMVINKIEDLIEFIDEN